MDIPKIRKEDLPEKLREIIGDQDAEFAPLVNPDDIIVLPDWDGKQFWGDKEKYIEMFRDTLTNGE